MRIFVHLPKQTPRGYLGKWLEPLEHVFMNSPG